MTWKNWTSACANAAASRLKVLVCHSPEDRAIDIEEGRAAARRLGDAGVTTTLVRYAGGHGFTVELVRRIVDWVEETAAGIAPTDPPPAPPPPGGQR